MDQMLNILISHESGGDPKIVNKTATPGGYHAAGLAQMIPPTFQSYNIPGLGGIFNPVANLAAAIRYMQDRYGSVANTPGIKSVMEGRGYEPY
jgi:SLT domain-containing protein